MREGVPRWGGSRSRARSAEVGAGHAAQQSEPGTQRSKWTSHPGWGFRLLRSKTRYVRGSEC
jgi:hypothetical protein